MNRADLRELDQLVRQHLRAGWHPALAACESAATLVQRRRIARSPSVWELTWHRIRVIAVAETIANNRSHS